MVKIDIKKHSEGTLSDLELALLKGIAGLRHETTLLGLGLRIKDFKSWEEMSGVADSETNKWLQQLLGGTGVTVLVTEQE